MAGNSAKQKREVGDDDVASRLYVVAPIEAWTGEAYDLIRASFPGLELIDIDMKSDLSGEAERGASILLLEAKTKAQTEASLKMIRRLINKIKKKTLTVIFLSNCESGHEEITKLEFSGMIQVLSPSISPAVLKLKIDFLFAKMKLAQKAMKKLETKDYVVRAEVTNKTSGEVISISASTAKFREKAPSAVQEARIDDYSAAAEILGREPARSIVLVSPRTQDLRLVSEIAFRTQSSFHYYHHVDTALTNFLTQHPDAIVFLDVDHTQASERSRPHSIANISDIISARIACSRVFAISDKNISRLPHISSEQGRVFSHSILRGESDAALQVYAKMVERTFCQTPFAIENYFDEKSESQVFTISQASHRTTAVLGVERFLIEYGLLPRIAVQAARAVDELILNAIQDAPIDSRGQHYRHGLTQPPNYKFNEQEKITLSAFKNDEYYAIFVQDYFGSLAPDSVLNNLQRTGLGLNTVIETGFSLHVMIHPGEMTAVSIFIPNVKSYVSFRKAFRFFSVNSLKKT